MSDSCEGVVDIAYEVLWQYDIDCVEVKRIHGEATLIASIRAMADDAVLQGLETG